MMSRKALNRVYRVPQEGVHQPMPLPRGIRSHSDQYWTVHVVLTHREYYPVIVQMSDVTV